MYSYCTRAVHNNNIIFCANVWVMNQIMRCFLSNYVSRFPFSFNFPHQRQQHPPIPHIFPPLSLPIQPCPSFSLWFVMQIMGTSLTVCQNKKCISNFSHHLLIHSFDKQSLLAWCIVYSNISVTFSNYSIQFTVYNVPYTLYTLICVG